MLCPGALMILIKRRNFIILQEAVTAYGILQLIIHILGAQKKNTALQYVFLGVYCEFYIVVIVMSFRVQYSS